MPLQSNRIFNWLSPAKVRAIQKIQAEEGPKVVKDHRVVTELTEVLRVMAIENHPATEIEVHQDMVTENQIPVVKNDHQVLVKENHRTAEAAVHQAMKAGMVNLNPEVLHPTAVKENQIQETKAIATNPGEIKDNPHLVTPVIDCPVFFCTFATN